MDPLASADDVAHALGLEDAAALSAAQTARVDGLLLRASRDYRREAERIFTPGTTTVRLLTVGGMVRLSEPADSVGSVEVSDCGDWVEVDEFTVDGQLVSVRHRGRLLASGVAVKVTYTHTADVPAEVAADVAGIVARHLTVEPGSSESMATDMAVGPFRVKYAGWTSATSLLTEDEAAAARRYRYPGSTVVIGRP